MKKTIITLLVALSLFAFAGVAAAADGDTVKYLLDGKEVTEAQFWQVFQWIQA